MTDKLTALSELAAKKEILTGVAAASGNDNQKSVPASTIDSDGDGIPDAWERLYGLNPFDPTDAAGDPDQDGMTNLEEFRRGTNPLKREARTKEEPVHPRPRGKSPSDDPTDG